MLDGAYNGVLVSFSEVRSIEGEVVEVSKSLRYLDQVRPLRFGHEVLNVNH